MRPHRRQPTRLPHPWDSPGKNLEWVAISFSNAWKWKVKVKSRIHVRLLATPWTAAYQAPPSMEFSRQEYWSGLPLPSQCLLKTPTVSSCDSQWADVTPGEKNPGIFWSSLKVFYSLSSTTCHAKSSGQQEYKYLISDAPSFLILLLPFNFVLKSNVLILLIYFFIYKMKIIITTLRIILKKSARII